MNSSRKILSVHFPKAGGSSLKQSLRLANSFKVQEVYHDDPIDPNSLSKLNPTESEKDALKICKATDMDTIYHGHFAARKFRLIEFNLRITIIRHPVDWIFSLYAFWSQMADEGLSAHSLYEEFKEKRPSILELAEHYDIRYCQSKAYFGEFNMEDFDFIGIQEQYNDSILRLGNILNANLKEERVNTSRGFKPTADPGLVNNLEHILRDDIEFYQYAKNLHWPR